MKDRQGEGSGRNRIGNKNLYVIILFFVVLAIFAVVMPYYYTKIMSGMRGHIAGESQWSKAQNTAVHELLRYGTLQDQRCYHNFRDAVDVIDDFKIIRESLASQPPDKQQAYEKLAGVQMNPEVIDDMIWYFITFRDYDHMEAAIQSWKEGEVYIEALNGIADEVRRDVEADRLSEQQWDHYMDRIFALDEELNEVAGEFATNIEDGAAAFSYAILLMAIGGGVLIVVIGGVAMVLVVRKVNMLNEQLTETKEKLSYVLDNSRDIIYQVDANSTNYEYVSPVVEEMLGYTVEELMEEGPQFMLNRVHPGDIDKVKSARQQIQQNVPEDLVELDTEYRLQARSGEYIWVNNIRSAVKDDEGNYIGVVGNVRDITERKRYMEELDKSLQEKNTLLAEIHHRVKNNLAIISSLIVMHKTGLDASTQDKFKELQARIKAIALVHEKLYQSESFGGVDLSEYISELADVIIKSVKADHQNITIDKQLESIHYDLSNAVTFGLICNELISNAFKHGFREQTEGNIKLELRQVEDHGMFAVKDDGQGLGDDFSAESSGTLGMTLVRNLAEQLNGDLEIATTEWTEFRVYFRLPQK